MENLHEFLSGTTNKMDVNSTETSEKEDVGFVSNIEIGEYMNYHTSSKSSKGGATIYVNLRTLTHLNVVILI